MALRELNGPPRTWPCERSYNQPRMSKPPITIKCECGETKGVAYGERWRCERCGRSWNTQNIPIEEYEGLLRRMRRHKLEVFALGGLMAAVLVFFPVMANVTRGLVQVEPGALELMRSYAASDWTILRKVRIPNALPYFFTAMKIATTLSLIGAIVGEYFGGANSVLGRLIVNSASALKFDITWAAILFGAATGIAFYLGVVVIERLAIPWAAAMRADS